MNRTGPVEAGTHTHPVALPDMLTSTPPKAPLDNFCIMQMGAHR